MLNRRQILFALEYLTDLNATQAAIRAGYSEKTARQMGAENLSKPDIQEAIQNAMRERSRRTEVTGDNVIKELAAVAFARVDDFITWGPGGLELKASGSLTHKQLAAVSEVTATPSRYGKNVRFKLADKLRALELLGEHLGIFDVSDRSDKTLLEAMHEAMTADMGPYTGGERPEDKN